MKIKYILLVVLIVVLGAWYLKYQADEKRYNNEISTITEVLKENNIPFIVPEGWSTTKIARKLEENNLIPSSWTFLRFLKKQKENITLMAGKFIFPQNARISDIVDVLSGKKEFLVSITIPEGYTARQIDKLLVDEKLIKEGEFASCIYENKCKLHSSYLDKNPVNYEGYLFPATYYASPANFSVEKFAQRLIDNLEARIPKEWIDELPKKNISFEQLIIMASMVERETRTLEEKPVVAGILWKRLNNNWALAVDATSRYINEKWGDNLTHKDFELDSDYNTRKNLGLPPTAISNPSLESIKASLFPQKSKYWFYLHGKDKHIRYAVTNDEHNSNKVRYLK